MLKYSYDASGNIIMVSEAVTECKTRLPLRISFVPRLGVLY